MGGRKAVHTQEGRKPEHMLFLRRTGMYLTPSEGRKSAPEGTIISKEKEEGRHCKDLGARSEEDPTVPFRYC